MKSFHFPSLEKIRTKLRLQIWHQACTGKRTWAENDGHRNFQLRRATNTLACGFHQGKPHEVRQRQQARQEIRGKPNDRLAELATTPHGPFQMDSPAGEVRGFGSHTPLRPEMCFLDACGFQPIRKWSTYTDLRLSSEQSVRKSREYNKNSSIARSFTARTLQHKWLAQQPCSSTIIG
jgi:hypothetical protein